MSTDDVRNAVKKKYGQAALQAQAGGSACCGADSSSSEGCNPITSNLYEPDQAGKAYGLDMTDEMLALARDSQARSGIAGAFRDVEYAQELQRAGFENVGIEPTRVYDLEDARQFLAGHGIDVKAIAPQVAGKFMSAFVRARKPAAAS